MEGGGHGKQGLAQIIKEDPEYDSSGQKLDHTDKPTEAEAAHRRLAQLAQTGGTQDPVVMLCDAFPAEKPTTFETASDSFSCPMVETTLMSEILHFNLRNPGPSRAKSEFKVKQLSLDFY